MPANRILTTCAALIALLASAAAKQPAEFSFALTGDSIITRKLSVYSEPTFTRIIDLVRGADVAFTNLEMLFHDYEPYAMNESGGTYMRAEPALVKELVWAGFDMVSRANNHAGDYGVLGMNLTSKYVAEAGLVQAGVGQSLAEAREAKFLETAEGARRADFGRVNVYRSLACGIHARRHARASRSESAALHDDHDRDARADGDTARDGKRGQRRSARDAAAGDDRRERSRSSAVASRSAPRQAFAPSRTPEDLKEIAAVVRSASGLADYTIVTIHSHEGGRDRVLAGGFPRHVRARDGRRGRRSLRRARPARAARHRAVQGQARLLQPRRFHLRERDAPAPAQRQLRHVRSRTRRARQRLQRRTLRPRQERVSGRSAHLGGGRRRPEVPRRSTRGARAASDHARLRQIAQRPRPPAIRGRRARSEDSGRSREALGRHGNEDRDPQRHRLRHAGPRLQVNSKGSHGDTESRRRPTAKPPCFSVFVACTF